MRLLYYIKISLILVATLFPLVSCTQVQSSDAGKADLGTIPPDNCQKARTLLQLGLSYQDSGNIDEAVNFYLEALKTKPTSDSLLAAICNQLATCYSIEDSILHELHHSQMSSIQESHAVELHKQELITRHQQNSAIIIICSLITIALIAYLSMYINNRNKKEYIYQQQQLMKNQAEKMQLKNELKQLLRTHQNIEKENQEMQDKLFELWKQTIQICARLFQTTLSYKKLMSIESTKVKKEREKSQEEIASIHKEINEVFATALQELSEMSTGLTSDDLLFCVLNYLNLSMSTIKICMRVESNQALTQRKYRIKKHLDPSIFIFVFGISAAKEGNG